MASTAAPLTDDERTAILDREMQRYLRDGYRVQSRSSTTARLIRPKHFSLKLAALGLLFFGIGLLVYLVFYATMPEPKILLSVDESGRPLAVAAND